MGAARQRGTYAERKANPKAPLAQLQRKRDRLARRKARWEAFQRLLEKRRKAKTATAGRD